MANPTDSRVPVTVLTGFLGSGKTTLLNRILTEHHGKRIAVIENEFGEVGVDQELVIGAEEEIFEMNNGCICCTVRGDLIRILGSLMKRKDRFDYILIETTGLADPGPVAQTFFMDDEIQSQLYLDAVVTVVDAHHVWQHFDDTPEVQEQIAFADVILLNKIDLVTPPDLDRLEVRIRHMNSVARILRTECGDTPIANILDVGGFRLDRALQVDARFLELEYPFEWAGVYHLAAGPHELVLQPGPDDPTMDIVLTPVSAASAAGIEEGLRTAELAFAGRALAQVYDGAALEPSLALFRLPLTNARRARRNGGSPEMAFPIAISQTGAYALFTEHHPSEFDLALEGPESCVHPVAEHEFKPPHEHNDEVTSVGITTPGDLEVKKLNRWLSDLLRTKGPDIFRMKGVLSIQGEAERFVFQGVHMLFDGRPDRPWGDEPRRNSLVFIGRNLDRDALNAGFRACLAQAPR